MWTFIKQMTCRHEYVKVGTILRRRYKRNKHFIVPMTEWKCKKCGKEIYRE